MKCPVCVTVDLSISQREGVEIDYCPRCRGVWLDRGELDKIIDRTAIYASQMNDVPVEHGLVEPEKRKNDYRDVRQAKPTSEPRVGYDRRDDDDDDDRRHRRGDKKRRMKSMLEEIFDIFD